MQKMKNFSIISTAILSYLQKAMCKIWKARNVNEFEPRNPHGHERALKEEEEI